MNSSSNNNDMRQSGMDVKVKAGHPLRKYKYLLIFGVVMLALVVLLIVRGATPSRMRYDFENLTVSEVKREKFIEYVNAEGVADALFTIRLSAVESGTVQEIVAHTGDRLFAGDTIIVLANPELERIIDEEKYNFEKQNLSYREKLIQLEKRSSELRRSTLKATYELERQSKQYELAKEEHKLGITSPAQLSVATDDYNYNRQNSLLLIDELRQDSLSYILQRELLESELQREKEKLDRSLRRLGDLVVVAPLDGQLNSMSLVTGDRVSAGAGIGEMKTVDEYKITIKIGEYYLDRIYPGLAASVAYQNREYPLSVTRINREVKDRVFEVDLAFTAEVPENIVLGKTYQVRVELGQPEEALVVDRGNFVSATGGRWIYKLNDAGTKAVRTDITISRQNPRQIEVIGGLKPGDKVIIAGYDYFGDAQELILK